MTRDPKLLLNPFWHALNTEHAYIAQVNGPVRRYPSEVLPFAGLAQPNDPDALSSLCDLLAPGESIWIAADQIATAPGLQKLTELAGWQMGLMQTTAFDERMLDFSYDLVPLHAADAPAMLNLTAIAFPGFFRPQSHILGRYFGVRTKGELIAMAGERIALPGFREISAVCTHPAHTGKGLAAALMNHILRTHRTEGLSTFLHVATTNLRAIALYQRFGFQITRAFVVHHLCRTGD